MGSLKIILAGTLAGVGMLVFMILFGFLAAPIYDQTPELWKPANALWYLGIILLCMLMGLIYALVYTTLGKWLKGGALDKGMLYGSILWFLGPLPSALLMHTMASIPPEIVVAWIFGGLIATLIAGVSVVFVFTQLKR